MKTEFKWTDGSDEDFRRFYLKTENYYSEIFGGRKNREGFIPVTSTSHSEHLLLAADSALVVALLRNLQSRCSSFH